MARKSDLLTALEIKNAGAGLHFDGGGLYLQVSEAGARSWIYRYRMGKRVRDMGLGSVDDVSLKNARKAAAAARALKFEGIDPIDDRAVRKAANRAQRVTFKQCAEEYIAAYSPSWRNEKHAQQWRNTLATYVYPAIGETPVGNVSTDAVLAILKPHWLTKTETLNRVRGRIEAVLDFAKARNWRSGDNIARWAGHLKNLLPARNRRKRIKHHPSMPYDAAPAFVAKVRALTGVTPRCLEFTILTAARTSETTRAEKAEFDLDAKLWTVPAGRIKGEREHKVPLTDRAIEILKEVWGLDKKFVFPGRRGKPLSNGAMLMLLERLGQGDVTVHGFRSTFRNWSGEQTSFPREICELALAHVNDDETEAAYLRTDYFEKRRKLMEAWARYLNGATDATPMRRKKA